jgi:hypothetical protein
MAEMRIDNSVLKPVPKYSMEITTKIGCPVNCLKYCPQEVLVKKYAANKRLLDLPDFSIVLSKIPAHVEIIFSGFCEPFANPKCLEMIDLAFRRSYTVSLYTTLIGASKTDVERLFNYRFKTFCLHLPDGEVMAFPSDPEYKQNVLAVLRNVKNVTTLAMTRQFKSNNRENVARQINADPKKFVFCFKFSNPSPILLPNGDVYLCCNDFGLRHKVGNLLDQDCDYAKVLDRIKSGRGRFELCNYCSTNMPMINHYYRVGREQIRTSLNYFLNWKRRTQASLLA